MAKFLANSPLANFLESRRAGSRGHEKEKRLIFSIREIDCIFLPAFFLPLCGILLSSCCFCVFDLPLSLCLSRSGGGRKRGREGSLPPSLPLFPIPNSPAHIRTHPLPLPPLFHPELHVCGVARFLLLQKRKKRCCWLHMGDR